MSPQEREIACNLGCTLLVAAVVAAAAMYLALNLCPSASGESVPTEGEPVTLPDDEPEDPCSK